MITSFVYILLGFLFAYLAVNSGDTLFSIRTLFPAIIATIDFGIAFRYLRIYIHIKRKKT